MSVESNKDLVTRAVAEVINGGGLDAIDRFYAREIGRLRQEWHV
jgi:hypothetical protein